MSKYNIHTLKDDEGDFFFCVYEEATEQAIDFFYFRDDAVEMVKFMEAGGAFNGFTPRFILIEVPVPVTVPDLNQRFSALCAEK
jgi:hypothetical protein